MPVGVMEDLEDGHLRKLKNHWRQALKTMKGFREMKKFRYQIRIWHDVVIFANNLDEAIERAVLEPFTEQDFTVIDQQKTGVPKEQLDWKPIHSQN